MHVYQPTILILPREILHAILVKAMQVRFQPSGGNYPSPRFSRALRLRLVCSKLRLVYLPESSNLVVLELFNTLYKQALFETRILDIYHPVLYPFHSEAFERLWPIRCNYGFQQFFHSYLAYRVRSESDPTIYRYREVRRIAESVCRNEADLQDTIDALCWLGLGVTLGRGWEEPHSQSIIKSQNLSLLSAAAFVGNMTLVERLLESGTDPTQTDGIFPSAIEAAALAGNVDIFQRIQESLPDVVEDQQGPFIMHYAIGAIHHKGKADIQGVIGAAMNGDIELLEMALYPPSRDNKTSAVYFDYIPNEPTTSYKQEHAQELLENAQFCAKNWEVYSRLASLLPEPHPSRPPVLIRRFAEYGNFNIVKNLLDAGCHVDGEAVAKKTSFRETPLYLASRFGNYDKVNLLLERGADVEKARLYNLRPLLGAIKSRSIPIVRKLLEYGATCLGYHVVEALFSEYEEMVDLLLGQFTEECCFHAGLGGYLAKEISDYGLSSMLELLHGRGYFQYVDGEIVTVPMANDDRNCELCGYVHQVNNGQVDN